MFDSLRQLEQDIKNLEKELLREKQNRINQQTLFYTIRRLYETGNTEELEKLLKQLTPHGKDNTVDE